MGFVVDLAEIYPSDFESVRREAEKTWLLFNERANVWVVEAILARWQRIALDRVRRAAVQSQSPSPQSATQPDEFSARVGELMRNHPEWSNERILGEYVLGGGEEFPRRWKKHAHRKGNALDAFRCPECR